MNTTQNIGEPEEPYKCDFRKCTFIAKRKDLLKVHVDETHNKILKACGKCGKTMTSSSLSRHKRFQSCQRSNKKKRISSGNCDTNDIVDIKKVKIRFETDIMCITHKDGSVTMEDHNGIQIGDLTLYLTRKKPDGIYVHLFF